MNIRNTEQEWQLSLLGASLGEETEICHQIVKLFVSDQLRYMVWLNYLKACFNLNGFLILRIKLLY